MATLEAKLLKLLGAIENGRYTSTELASMVGLQEKIAHDIGAEPPEAMALLGYLLRNRYVQITPDGISVNGDMRNDIDLLKKGMQ